MIENSDRSNFIGASDVDKVIGNWGTKTFEKWWTQKLGINRDSFSNKFTDAGTHYEHRILESLGIPMELDKQVIIGRLRVNLDGNTDDCIYECKTYQFAKGFKLPKKYVQQVQVQMYATGIKRAKIVVYGLVEGDYDNYFHEIDKSRLMIFDIEYDAGWINTVFLPKFNILEKCLEEGRFPLRLSGKIVGGSIDFKTNKPTVTFEVNELNDFKLMMDELNDKALSIEVKQYKPKRSLNANNYAWKLITEIANIVRASKDEVYLKMLKRYGQSEMFSVLSHIPFGNYVKYYEEAGESELNGKMFTHYRVFKGSSEFDSREMSIFIDGVVSEAKELGIQTETPNELAKMKSLWGQG